MSGLKAKGALSMYTEVKRAVCSKLAVSVLIFIQRLFFGGCQKDYIYTTDTG